MFEWNLMWVDSCDEDLTIVLVEDVQQVLDLRVVEFREDVVEQEYGGRLTVLFDVMQFRHLQ